jgi:ribosomal protein S18 acetylase RimI-like enzyme
MIIRPLISQDKTKIFCLLQQRGTFNNNEIKMAMELIDASLDYPEKKHYHVFCATDDGNRLAGYICFGPIPTTDGCHDLYWIVVDEEYERRGIGGKLLECMVKFVIREKGRRIYVDTSSTHPYAPARSFYNKHGYTLVSLLSDFYRGGDHKMILMKEVFSDEKNGT